MFVNRRVELDHLERIYCSDKAEMYVLYGRRRVGKTELLRAFCSNRPHLFFVATLSSDNEQLANFSQQIYQWLHSEAPAGFTYPSWEAAFRALIELPGKPKPIVIIDEFTYLISGNKAIPSILQKVWDEKLKQSNLMLILCGSYIGMMESEVLGYQAPLFGRRTASVLLKPLDLPSSASFFPAYSLKDQFLAWAILGGMPYYLRTFSDQEDIYSNIRKHILDAQSGVLFSEPRLLLMEELREPRNYFSILRSIAQGRTRLNQITQASGLVEPTAVARYLDILQQMRLITRRVPATETRPEKSKKGIYQIDDHFLRFWFRYIHPNQNSLDLGLADAVLEQSIQPDLAHFVAIAFEEAARAFVTWKAQMGNLPFLPERIGSWWDRTSEIDVLAISFTDKRAMVGECKWSINPVGVNVLEELKQKSHFLESEYGIREIYYALFSRSGFTPALEKEASQEKVALYTVDEMVMQDA